MTGEGGIEGFGGGGEDWIVSKRRTAMHVNHERVALARVDRRRRDQHALDVVRCALPIHVRGIAGDPGHLRIRPGDGPPRARRARAYLRRHYVGLQNDRRVLSVPRERDPRVARSEAHDGVCPDHLRCAPELSLRPAIDVDQCQHFLAGGELRRHDARRRAVPGKGLNRGRKAGCDIDGRPAILANYEEVAAGDRLVAHQATDVGDPFAVPRPAWRGHLQRRFEKRAHRAGRRIHPIEFGNPPVVVARPVRRGDDELAAVGGPVVLVDVQVGRAERPDRAAVDRDHGQPLFIDRRGQVPGVAAERIERAWQLGGSLGIEEGDALAVGRPARRIEGPVRARERPDPGAVRIGARNLRLLPRIGRYEGNVLPVG